MEYIEKRGYFNGSTPAKTVSNIVGQLILDQKAKILSCISFNGFMFFSDEADTEEQLYDKCSQKLYNESFEALIAKEEEDNRRRDELIKATLAKKTEEDRGGLNLNIAYSDALRSLTELEYIPWFV